MRLAKFSKVIEKTYTDTLSSYRCEEVLNEDNTTSVETSEMAFLTNVPCRISFNSSDSPETVKEDTNPQYLQMKIFCAPTLDIRKGDKLVVQRRSDDGTVLQSYTGTANLPYVFTTHQEILIVQVGDA